jgi:uncharacterized membrane protein YoaK (UPF0700 family)
VTSFEERAGLWHAAALCLIAGFVDAVGYFEHGHVFTANMTGNTVLLGAAIAYGDWLALTYAATIVSFALGVATSTLLKLARVALPALLVIAGGLLGAIQLIDLGSFALLSALSFVMGLQGGAIATFSGIRLPTVVVTSTLVNLIDGLIRRGFQRRAVRAGAPPPSHVAHLAAAWIAYGVGGAAAVATSVHVPLPLLIPAVLYGVVAVGLLDGWGAGRDD